MKKSMVRTVLFVGYRLVLVLCAVMVTAQENKSVQTLLQGMEAAVRSENYTQYGLGLGQFTFKDTGTAGNFVTYLRDTLKSSLQNGTRFTIVSDEQVSAVNDAVAGSLTSPVPRSATRPPKKNVQAITENGLHGILRGRYYDLGDKVEVFVELKDVTSNSIIKSGYIYFPMQEIDARGLTLTPENEKQALQPEIVEGMKKIEAQTAIQEEKTAFYIEAWPSSGNGAAYRLGERMRISLVANKDCWFRVLHIDVNNVSQPLHPNPKNYNEYTFLKANETLSIPQGSRYWEVSKPFGTERIIVEAVQAKNTGAKSSGGNATSNTLGVPRSARGLTVYGDEAIKTIVEQQELLSVAEIASSVKVIVFSVIK